MFAHTLVRIVLLLVVGCVAVGYASAYAQLEPCRDQAWAEVASQGILVRRLGTTATPLRRDDLEARIVGPFLVEVNYLVPQALEGTLHVRKYFVLPWKRTLRGTQAHTIPLMT